MKIYLVQPDFGPKQHSHHQGRDSAFGLFHSGDRIWIQSRWKENNDECVTIGCVLLLLLGERVQDVSQAFQDQINPLTHEIIQSGCSALINLSRTCGDVLLSLRSCGEEAGSHYKKQDESSGELLGLLCNFQLIQSWGSY